jgi:hypothetical protein
MLLYHLSIAERLYRNRQGVTKVKKRLGLLSTLKRDLNHRTQPELASELIRLVAGWIPHNANVGWEGPGKRAAPPFSVPVTKYPATRAVAVTVFLRTLTQRSSLRRPKMRSMAITCQDLTRGL